MSYFDNINGQFTLTAYQKVNDFLIAHSPKSNLGKHFYDGLLVIPATFIAKIGRCVLEPLEQIATAGFHLCAAPFVKDSLSELKKARNFILLEFPLSTVTNVGRAILSPFGIIVDEAKAAMDPKEFEEERHSSTFKYEIRNSLQDTYDYIKHVQSNLEKEYLSELEKLKDNPERSNQLTEHYKKIKKSIESDLLYVKKIANKFSASILPTLGERRILKGMEIKYGSFELNPSENSPQSDKI